MKMAKDIDEPATKTVAPATASKADTASTECTRLTLKIDYA